MITELVPWTSTVLRNRVLAVLLDLHRVRTQYYCVVFHFAGTKLKRKNSKNYKGPSENVQKLTSKNKNKCHNRKKVVLVKHKKIANLQKTETHTNGTYTIPRHFHAVSVQ